MRLIDADRLRAKITAMVTRPHQVMYEIERAPTVKAIPIEFIEAFKKEVRDVANGKAVIERLLEEWEKENAVL